MVLGAIVLGWYLVTPVGMLVIILARGIERYDRGLGRNWIIYFRAFCDDAAARFFSKTVNPILDCFGTTVMAASNAPFSVNRITVFINFIHRRRSNVIGDLQLPATDWQAGVLTALEEASLAVVEMSTPTENVLWELDVATRKLGANRVVLVTQASTDEGIGAPDVARVCRDSASFHEELAKVLADKLPSVPPLRRLALHEFLRARRLTPMFLGLLLCDIYRQWFIHGMTIDRRTPAN